MKDALWWVRDVLIREARIMSKNMFTNYFGLYDAILFSSLSPCCERGCKTSRRLRTSLPSQYCKMPSINTSAFKLANVGILEMVALEKCDCSNGRISATRDPDRCLILIAAVPFALRGGVYIHKPNMHDWYDIVLSIHQNQLRQPGVSYLS